MAAWEIVAFAAMVYLFLVATYTEIYFPASAFPKAIIRYVPTTFAQGGFFHYRFGTFVFTNPPLAFKPFNQ